ncbi:hypothetical protein [Paracoccus denitrificans]|nr:hypothetical protein [Paracoccus denitrificans]MBB4630297.1 hypothetical protein [Paracoccus denitrificans]MCU7431661.1 hypothetical protein [Paracoccus denitrificans]QAR27114.1 hypothetical protein EO213_12820 [Paracoccus denitrificans]WQO34559.1 hypothetical protein U0005_05750 [Paracoccus denitrificans]
MAAIDNIDFQLRNFGRRVPVARDRRARATCWFIIALFAAGLLFCLVVACWMLWDYLPDTGAVLDFIAPTAVQARDGGWVAMSEGL